MSQNPLNYLVANWELIASSLTKMNDRSLQSFRLLMSSTIASLAVLRNTPVTTSHLLKLLLQTDQTQRNSVEFLSYHVLTVELPTLGKDVLSSLSTGRFVNTSGFALLKNSALPAFLHECFFHYYDNHGNLRHNATSDIATLRQILMMYYKFEFPFTEEQELASHQKFIEIDNSVKTTDWPKSLDLVGAHFNSALPLDPYDFVPCHSNGATNTKGISNLDKRQVWRFNTALHGICYGKLPPLKYFVSDTMMPVSSKLTVVPKDSRGPRTICMEPHERMYAQKGLMQKIYDHVESNQPTRGYVNFTDQAINQALAYSSSIDGKYATLDLKDASDLVSWSLIQQLLKNNDWLEVLTATRSSTVDTLLGNHKLKKFAPMGSALCFPIEALLFWSISMTVTSEVYVYGDDIIVNRIDAQNVISALESYGLKVNVDKSFLSGRFRESCGAYYYNGHDVSIVQCNSLDVPSVVEFCNLLYKRFLNEDLHDKLILMTERYLGMFIPRSNSAITPSLCFISNRTACNDYFLKRRYNVALQKYQYRILQQQVDKEASFSDDYFGYHEWTTSRFSHTSFEDMLRQRSTDRLLNKRYSSFCSLQFSAGINIVKPRKKLSFTWIDRESLMETLPSTF